VPCFGLYGSPFNAVWIGIQRLNVFGIAPNTAQGLLPKGIIEGLVWLPVALSAGFCEELAFRGYLQRQFRAIAGSATLAVLLQGIIFGVGHLYEGPQAVARITVYGVLYGLLAAWRRSLRPGMIAYAWSDISGVIIFRGL
jgi:CAAX protease family protein